MRARRDIGALGERRARGVDTRHQSDAISVDQIERADVELHHVAYRAAPSEIEIVALRILELWIDAREARERREKRILDRTIRLCRIGIDAGAHGALVLGASAEE